MKEPEGRIVADYKSGNTWIRIADDCYCDKTEADITEILSRIADNARRAFISAGTSNPSERGNAMEETTNEEQTQTAHGSPENSPSDSPADAVYGSKHDTVSHCKQRKTGRRSRQ